jgi:bifunctional DNase/RNase
VSTAPGPRPASDPELVGRRLRDERPAFAEPFSRRRALLEAVVRGMLADPAMAEDAVQEAAVTALSSLDRLRDPGRFGPWLAGIGLNVRRQWLRRRARDPWSWESLQRGLRWEGALAEVADPGSLCPGPYGLMGSVLDASGATLEEVRVTRLAEEVFHAELVISVGDRRVAVDARPSDALNLALRLGSPVAVSEELLDRLGRSRRLRRADRQIADAAALVTEARTRQEELMAAVHSLAWSEEREEPPPR